MKHVGFCVTINCKYYRGRWSRHVNHFTRTSNNIGRLNERGYSQPFSFFVLSSYRFNSFIHAFFNPPHTSSNHHEERRRETNT